MGAKLAKCAHVELPNSQELENPQNLTEIRMQDTRLGSREKWPAKTPDPITHIGTALLSSNCAGVSPFLGQIPIHEPPAKGRLTIARDSSFHVAF